MNINLFSRIQVSQSAKLAFFVFIAAKILVFVVGFIVEYLNTGSAPSVTDIFNRWDASQYVNIAKNWYVSDPTLDAYNSIVFFPLYPILIRLFTIDINYINLSALVISNVCSAVAFLYLYKLAKLEFSEGIAVKAVLFLSIFPTAYFLSAPYTESLFFALAIASFYYARLCKWQFAGILSLFASLTRITGLILLPVLVIEYLHQIGWKPKKIGINVLWAFLALVGFLIYLNINYQVTGNPFTFTTIEAVHWFNRLDPWAGLTSAYYWATTASYPDNITLGIAPIAFAIFGLLTIGISVWKRLRPAYITFMFLAWALAVSTSWWISVPRYVMAMFPMFLLFGLLSRKKAVTISVVILSGALLCYFTAIFAMGWWAF